MAASIPRRRRFPRQADRELLPPEKYGSGPGKFRGIVVGGGSAASKSPRTWGISGGYGKIGDHSRVPVGVLGEFPEKARARAEVPSPLGRRNIEGLGGIDRQRRVPIGRRRESRGRNGVRRDRIRPSGSFWIRDFPQGKDGGLLSTSTACVDHPECSGAGLRLPGGSPWPSRRLRRAPEPPPPPDLSAFSTWPP